VILRYGSDLYIHGWIFTSDADIESVYVTCNGAQYPATYPVKRPELACSRGAWIDSSAIFPPPPHTRDLHPDLDPPYNFGFVTAPIPLDSGAPEAPQHVEICLTVTTNGHEHILLIRQVEILWTDPESDLFNFGAIGPFKYPRNFNKNSLLTHSDRTPIFLVGDESAIHRTLCALETRGFSIPNTLLLRQMFETLVACYDVYCEFDQLYFKPLESQHSNVGSSKFKIYDLLNAIITSFHDLLPNINNASFVHALTSESDVDLIPMLRCIYPNCIFVRVRAVDSPETRSSDRGTRDRNFAQKMHILEHGNARITFQDIQLDAQDNSTSDLRAVEQLIDLLRLSKSTCDEYSKARELITAEESGEVTEQTYLQALPSYDEDRPIFVLGAGRSGTSATAGALKAAGIAGFYEGHVFPLINEMAQRVWELPVLHAKPDRLQKDLRAHAVHLVVKTCFEQVYGDLHNCVWLDKTADHLMIYCVPLLRKMFPRARFLFLRRHPIAVAESRSRKFGETPFFSILEWNKCMRGWLDQKHQLAGSAYLECDANALRDSQLHSRLSDFLGLDPQSSEKFSNYLATQSPEMTRISPLDELDAFYVGLDDRRKSNFKVLLASLLDLLDVYIEDTGWDANTIAWAQNSLGTLPEQFGYAIYRPKNMEISLLANLAKQIDQYRHTAELHQAETTHWKEQYDIQMTNLRHWKEQHDMQMMNVHHWKEQHNILMTNADSWKKQHEQGKWSNARIGNALRRWWRVVLKNTVARLFKTSDR